MVHRVASTTADNNISFATDLHSTTFNSFLLLFLTHFRRQSNKVNQKTFQECFRINQKATYIFAILFTLSPRSPFIALFIIFHKNRYSSRFHSIQFDYISHTSYLSCDAFSVNIQLLLDICFFTYFRDRKAPQTHAATSFCT